MASLLSFFAASSVIPVAQAAVSDRPYAIQESAPKTGSRLRESIATGSYPLDKPWSRFSDEEKARFRALYVDMPVDDEPPFPKHGMRPVIETLSRVMGAANKQGAVYLEMTVDAKGKAKTFKIYTMPDADTARYVAAVFSATEFKPGKCGGQPCEMDFPFKLRIVLD